MVEQLTRDQQFVLKTEEVSRKFHDKNLLFKDAFLTHNDTIEECFEEISRQFGKAQSKVKYANSHLNVSSLQHDLTNLATYVIMTQIWLDEQGSQYTEVEK